MKMSSFEEVNRLIGIRDKCEYQLRHVDVTIFEQQEMEDQDDKTDIFNGYYCHVSQHSDGSGENLDLTGCYIGLTVAKATVAILENQIDRINERLTELGVDLEK